MVTVNQLVAGYSVEGRVDLRSDFFTNTFDFSDDVAVGIGGTFSDRPTVTYTPIKGDDFARVMLTPIPPSELFAMLTTGAPAELTLGLGRAFDQRPAQLDARMLRANHTSTRNSPRCSSSWRRWGAMASWVSASTSQAGPRTAYLLMEDQADGPLDARARRLLDLLKLDPAVRELSDPLRLRRRPDR